MLTFRLSMEATLTAGQGPGSLANKHVVIVGASSGMGLALAKEAASAGARLTLFARDRTKLQAAAQQIAGAEIRVIDLCSSETIPPAVAGLVRVDHLVITAGTYAPVPLAKSGPEEWRAKLEERLVGPLLMIKLLMSEITTSIVLFSGTVSRRPSVGVAMSAAATAGSEAMVRALAIELAPIRVNAIVPGIVDTPMLDKALGASKKETIAQAAQKLPAKRIGTPQDAAQAALFLMTNPFVTGTSLLLDGGGVLV